jgi:phenylpropionate dioxygenase-like ring-hydroxylating dioxygenase large terminal subunit
MTSSDIAAMVTDRHVHRRVYVDPALFELEMDRLFGRVWLYAAHESQLRQSGDFVRTLLGRHEVLVIRQENGGIAALHNRCAHRGAALCATDRGNARRLVCPYHAWTYRTDGVLESVPHPASYPGDFDRTDAINGLRRVPRVESYRGFVFASLASEGVSLRDYLGEMAGVIDNLVDRAPSGEVELGDATFQLEYRGNWKFHNENAADVFHPSFVHASSIGVARAAPPGQSPLDEDQTREQLLANGFGREQWEGITLTALPGGHSYMTGFYRQGVLAPGRTDPVALRYHEALARRHGGARADEILSVDRFNNLIFPTLNLNAQYQQMRVVVPVAVDRTIIRVSCFRLLGAPDEIFERAVRFLTNIGSPASMIFSDDLEMLGRCQAGITGSTTPWLNIERGRERSGNTGRRDATASELPMRAQLQAWAAHMGDVRP